MYYYLTFASTDYGEFVSTSSIVDALTQFEGLIQKDSLQFSSLEGFPWVIVQLAVANTEGNYAVNISSSYTEINCIELITTIEDFEGVFEGLIKKIQSLTGWNYVN
jgi:hypothetical protein